MSKIVFLGHSVVKGTGYGSVTTTDTFAHKIGIANNYTAADILNKGVSSDTTTGMRTRFTVDVLANSPSVCVFAGCVVNDWATGIPVATTKANLLSMVTDAQATGIKCVMFTDNVNRGTASEFNSYYPYIEAIREVANLKGVRLVDTYGRMCQKMLVGEHVSLYVDVIHLSIAGHQFFADLANKSYYSGFFVADPVIVPPPLPDSNDTKGLVLAITDYILNSANSNLTSNIILERAKLVV